MSDDEYLREIVQDDLDALHEEFDELEIEICEEFENEQDEKFDPHLGPSAPNDFMTRVYKRLVREFPDYESRNGPRMALEWTVAKRRCVRENIKNFRDHRLMRCAIAATCKALYVANAKGSESEVKPEFGKRQLHFKDTPSKKVWVLVREWLR